MAVTKAKQKPTSATIADLVHEVFQDFVQGRLVRCAHCKLFHSASQAEVASCSVCIYVTGRCFSCGGEDGVRRSVLAHIRIFSSSAKRDAYGDAHYDAKVSFAKTAKAKLRKFKIVRGGKK